MKLDTTLTTVVKQNLRLGRIPILLGRAGVGKTSILRSAAGDLESDSFTLAVNLVADKADLTGARLVQYTKADGSTDYQQSFFPHEDIVEAIDYAEAHPDETPLLILDEINRTSADVTSGALGISTDRKIGRRRLPKNLLVAATGNDTGNVAAMDEASFSRFMVLHVEADAQTFMAHMGDRLNTWIRQVLEADNDLINGQSTPQTTSTDSEADDEDEVDVAFGDPFGPDESAQITTPRTLEYLSDWLNDTDTDTLAGYLSVPAVINGNRVTYLDELIQSFVGSTDFATQLVAKIAEDIGVNVGTAAITAPDAYDQLVQATTMTQLVGTITAMGENERADALVYALRDAQDASRFLTPLAENIDDLGTQRNDVLIDLARNQHLDTDNLRAFLDSGTDLADHYEPYLASFI